MVQHILVHRLGQLRHHNLERTQVQSLVRPFHILERRLVQRLLHIQAHRLEQPLVQPSYLDCSLEHRLEPLELHNLGHKREQPLEQP